MKRSVLLVVVSTIVASLLSCAGGPNGVPNWNITDEQSIKKGNYYSGTNEREYVVTECAPRHAMIEMTLPELSTLTKLPSPLNSEADDYSIALEQKKSGVTLITSSRGPVQALYGTTTSGELVGVQLPQRSLNFGSAAALAPDGKTLYFSLRTLGGSNNDADLYSGVLSRTRSSVALTTIRPLAELNSEFWDSQPCLSPDGRTLYFASNRDSGEGGLDIWYATKNPDGAWNAPKNCGPEINTACDELTPSVAPDGSLYFASNGRTTVGGYDIFFSHNNGASWSEPHNFGAPVNSDADELSPFIWVSAENDTVLYFSSNRHAPGSPQQFDLYSLTSNTRALARVKETNDDFSLPPERKPDIRHIDTLAEADTTLPPVRLEGVVRASASHAPVRDAEIFWSERGKDSTIKTTHTNDSGEYNTELARGRTFKVGAQSGDKFYEVVTLVTPRDTMIRVIRQNFSIPETLALRINFPFNDAKNPYDFTLDENGNQTTDRWTEALNLLARNYISYSQQIKKLTLTGHTDSVGTTTFNIKLGLRRVEFIKAELVKRGVPAKSIITRSAGKHELLPKRAGETSEVWQARCRRVVMSKVIVKK